MTMTKGRYDSNATMRQLVSDNSSLITVLGRFGIPLGFGRKTVKEVCDMHAVDVHTFVETVNFLCRQEYSCENISLPTIMGYLKEAHDYFLKFKLPNIRRKLIEAIDCSDSNEIAMVILRFYDEYVQEVRRHMEYENETVFIYVENLISGIFSRDYNISTFSGAHAPIGYKLKELKDVIIQYYPEKNNYLLNDVLLDIIDCETDLDSHCQVEDRLFVPAVEALERKMAQSCTTIFVDENKPEQPETDKSEALSEREKDIIIEITKGLSNKEIADRLCLSVHTVATHRRNIANKLQIHTTAGIIVYAIANKLINLKDIT